MTPVNDKQQEKAHRDAAQTQSIKGVERMFMAFDRMKMEKKILKDNFGAIDIIIGIVMPKNRA